MIGLVLTLILGVAAVSQPAGAQTAITVPPGFIETQVGPRLAQPPVSLLQTPDGRILVTRERDDRGAIDVISNGALVETPALEIDLVSEGEFGMVGAVLHPDFAQNGYIYVMYTSDEGGRHNRLSRFQFQGDTIPPESETPIFHFGLLGPGTVHNGGGMAFASDGTLIIGVGDNASSANARTLDNLFGKILRINADGTIPTDNPFYTQAAGDNRAIYAIGVRNPYSMDADPQTGRIFFNDVGPAGPEEINEVVLGAGPGAGPDYAWPLRTGNSNDPAHTNPIYSYRHIDSTPEGCAITGGAFSRPAAATAPAAVQDKYFFADYCGGWIDSLDLDTGVVTRFASDVAAGPVSLLADGNGALYYLSRATRTVRKIEFAGEGSQASISQQPQNTSVVVGSPATFTVQVSGAIPTSYRWQTRTGTDPFTDIPGATDGTYTLSSPSLADNGAQYRVIVTTPTGDLTSEAATLTVIDGSPPVPVIETPLATDTYVAGDLITFSGYATDPDEPGNLPLSNLTWEVTFQHDDHDHPELAPFSGAAGGSFLVPVEGETSANTWFRIHLTATDSTGLSTYTFRDIFPETSFFTLETNVPGIGVLLDGTPVSAPITTEGVVGVLRSIGAPVVQTVGGTTYQFVRWEHGGERVHTIATAATDQTYTAIFEPVDGPGPDPDAGLITHFMLDEGQGASGADSAPTGRPDIANLAAGATWTTEGQFDGAVLFDGIDDHLAVPDSTDFNDKDVAATTIAFWFRADDVGRPGTQLLYKQGGGSRGLTVYLNGGRLYVGGWSENASWATGTFLDTAGIESGRWHHVALVLDAEPVLAPDSIRGHLDGALFGSGPAAIVDRHLGNVSFGAADGPTFLHTGPSPGSFLLPFAGAIDDIRVYDRALTTAELAALGGPEQPQPTCGGLVVTVDLNLGEVPTAGDDVILGTAGADAISALGGNDVVCGDGGADTIYGGPGDDVIYGDGGDDTIFGGDGDDTISGGPGNDTIQGNGGNDTIDGGAGDDVLSGNDGLDVIDGGDGADTIYGGASADTIDGGDGADTILGGLGNDVIDGGEGNDLISGNAGADEIDGGAGDDVIFGVDGNDIIFGGVGNDTILGGEGNDTIDGGDGDDQLSGNGGDDEIFGRADADVIYGVDGNDTLSGGPGDDIILGGNDDDTIDGGGGNDLLSGNDGVDAVGGGGGDDEVYGAAGNDTLSGGAGLDVILGGPGDDVIDAADGEADLLSGNAGIDACTADVGIDTVFDCEVPVP